MEKEADREGGFGPGFGSVDIASVLPLVACLYRLAEP